MAIKQGQRYVRIDVASVLVALLEAAAHPRRRLNAISPGRMIEPGEEIVGASVESPAAGTPLVMVLLVEKVDAEEAS